MSDEDFKRNVMHMIDESGREQREMDFAAWRKQLADVPADYKPSLKEGKMDIELQAFRWLHSGIELIKSSKGTVSVQTRNLPGLFLNSFLPYPVFQMGTEIFLKGMWLCQFEECRSLTNDSYTDATVRQNHNEKLKKLGHDLIEIIAAIRQIRCYADDPEATSFLKEAEGIIRTYYFPLYEADKRGNHWANCRYPKRFYNDATRESSADEFQVYPEQAMIEQLFIQTKRRIDCLWGFPWTI